MSGDYSPAISAIAADVSSLIAAWERGDKLPSEVAGLLVAFVLRHQMAGQAIAETDHLGGQALTVEGLIEQFLQTDD